MKRIYVLLFLLSLGLSVAGQGELALSLDKVIKIASDSSIISFKNKNDYLRKAWQYNLYKANLKPQISFSLKPSYSKQLFTPNSGFVQNESAEIFNGLSEISMRQQVAPLGGYMYASAIMSWQKYFNMPAVDGFVNPSFGATPLLVGYRHELLGYNEFKWEKQLSDLQFELAVKEFLYGLQEVAELATAYFFQLARAEADYMMANKNALSSDTLYQIGIERYSITSIKKEELLALELQQLNAHNALHNAELNLEKAQYSLLSFLRIEHSGNMSVEIPRHHEIRLVDIEDAMLKAQDNNPQYLQIKENLLQAEQNLDKVTKESKFQVGLDVNVGMQQYGSDIGKTYHNPQRYTTGSVSFSVPLVDFGAAKSKKRIANYSLETVKDLSDETERTIREEIVIALKDFNSQQQLITKAEQAITLADLSFDQIQRSYAMGQTDMNTFILSQNRKDEAYTNYISALQNYWMSYYKMCRLTLFDYIKNVSLVQEIDIILE